MKREEIIQRLSSAGMSGAEAQNKAKLLARAVDALGADSCDAFFVPGRLECLGKHTDYAGGHSLICAIERGFVLVSSARSDMLVRVIDVVGGETQEFAISPELTPTMGHWVNYPMTVAARLARNFPGKLNGADIAFISDLPPEAGMSSSSALMVGIFLALAGVNDLADRQEYRGNIDSTESLASYLGTIENGQSFGTLAGSKGVGTFGGSEDHTAILCGRAGELSCYSYCPVRLEGRVDVPSGFVFAIGASGVVADKTGSARDKYNRASRLVSVGLEVWNAATGRDDKHLADALGSGVDAVERMRELLRGSKRDDFTGAELLKRFEHFVAENNEIIPAAMAALSAKDIPEFGRQVDRSQELSETLLGNQVANTVFLARDARQLGAVAASAFGAGFGGAVWAMVAGGKAEQFLEEWKARYRAAYPEEGKPASFFVTRPGPRALAIRQ